MGRLLSCPLLRRLSLGLLRLLTSARLGLRPGLLQALSRLRRCRLTATDLPRGLPLTLSVSRWWSLFLLLLDGLGILPLFGAHARARILRSVLPIRLALVRGLAVRLARGLHLAGRDFEAILHAAQRQALTLSAPRFGLLVRPVCLALRWAREQLLVLPVRRSRSAARRRTLPLLTPGAGVLAILLASIGARSLALALTLTLPLALSLAGRHTLTLLLTDGGGAALAPSLRVPLARSRLLARRRSLTLLRASRAPAGLAPALTLAGRPVPVIRTGHRGGWSRRRGRRRLIGGDLSGRELPRVGRGETRQRHRRRRPGRHLAGWGVDYRRELRCSGRRSHLPSR